MVRNTYEVQTLGELLREKRKSLGEDLKDVSISTKIRSEYLLALESGNYSKFVSAVYAKGFLKKYAKYLGINPERAIAMYRREQGGGKDSQLESTNKLVINDLKSATVNWTRLISSLVLFVILGFLVFLGFQLNTVFESPELSLTNPIQAEMGEAIEYTSNVSEINLVGKITPGSTLTLNGIDTNSVVGSDFVIENVELVDGLNEYRLVATSQFGQSAELLINISFEDPGSEPVGEEPVGGETSLGETISFELENPTEELIFVEVTLDNSNVLSREVLVAENITELSGREILINVEKPGLVGKVGGVTYAFDMPGIYTLRRTVSGGVEFLPPGAM